MQEHQSLDVEINDLKLQEPEAEAPRQDQATVFVQADDHDTAMEDVQTYPGKTLHHILLNSLNYALQDKMRLSLLY